VALSRGSETSRASVLMMIQQERKVECLESWKRSCLWPVDGDEPGWVLEHAKREKRQALVEQRAEQETKLKNIREKELRQKQRYENDHSRSKRRVCFAIDNQRMRGIIC
jgi:pyruvoyl-dependent arginine decarboxylase (PvlArgDC)